MMLMVHNFKINNLLIHQSQPQAVCICMNLLIKKYKQIQYDPDSNILQCFVIEFPWDHDILIPFQKLLSSLTLTHTHNRPYILHGCLIIEGQHFKNSSCTFRSN